MGRHRSSRFPEITVFIVSAVASVFLVLSCTSSFELRSDSNYLVSFQVQNYLAGHDEEVAALTRRLDSLLILRTANDENVTIVGSRMADSEANHAFTFKIDSLLILPDSLQTLIVRTRNSIYNEYYARTDSFYMDNPRLTDGQKLGRSIAATVLRNALTLPFGVVGVAMVGDAEAPGMSYDEEKRLEQLYMRSRMVGTVPLECNMSGTVLWQKTIIANHEYYDPLPAEEQARMLFSCLYGEFNNGEYPFLHNDAELPNTERRPVW